MRQEASRSAQQNWDLFFEIRLSLEFRKAGTIPGTKYGHTCGTDLQRTYVIPEL